MDCVRPGRWPAGSGEMAALVREHDWAATPLGPVEGWPQSLRTAVDTCLGSGFASFVWWGHDLVQVYNDAALSIVRAKHPAAFGAPARRAWSDVWEVVGPLVERVLGTGKPELGEDMPMVPERGGPPKEAYFTFSYSALRDEAGSVAGMLITAIETTERVLSDRRREQAEEELREREERLGLAVEAADLGRWELVPETGEFYTSAICNRHLGLPHDARPTHEGHFETIHPDDHEMIYERLRRAVDEVGEFEAEYRVLHLGGEVRRILSRGRLVVGAGTASRRLLGVTLDVTEVREAEKESERALARELTALAEAAERERISRELHDRVAHHMGVAHQSLELYTALAESAPDRAREKLKLAKETTRVALDQTRALSAELKRLQDEELGEGFEVAFWALAASYVPDGVEVDVHFSGDESAIPNAMGTQVYLAMREAIRNAVRHSRCSRIGITLKIRDGEVYGLVEDDGEGFDQEAVGMATPSWGVGLRSMRERAEMLGGSLRLESKPGDGTRVEIRVLLNGRRP